MVARIARRTAIYIQTSRLFSRPIDRVSFMSSNSRIFAACQQLFNDGLVVGFERRVLVLHPCEQVNRANCLERTEIA